MATTLNLKQQKFADLYLQTGNATRSYMDAGYKAKDADVAGTLAARLLGNDRVRAYIMEARDQMRRDGRVKTEDLIQKAAEIAFTNLDDIMDIDEQGAPRLKPGASLNAFDSISVSESSGSESNSKSFSVKRSDRLKALDVLAKLTGAYDTDEGDGERNLADSAGRILAALRGLRKK